MSTTSLSWATVQAASADRSDDAAFMRATQRLPVALLLLRAPRRRGRRIRNHRPVARP